MTESFLLPRIGMVMRMGSRSVTAIMSGVALCHTWVWMAVNIRLLIMLK